MAINKYKQASKDLLEFRRRSASLSSEDKNSKNAYQNEPNATESIKNVKQMVPTKNDSNNS